MKTKLPTKPGAYLYTPKNSSEPIATQVTNVFGMLLAYSYGIYGVPVESLKGQWSPCHNPDGGVEAWGVYNQHNILKHVENWKTFAVSRAEVDYGKSWENLKAQGYTCKKVRVFKEVEG